MLADVLSGQPNGIAQIESLGNRLMAATQAPPELLAKDSMFVVASHTYGEIFSSVFRMMKHLGKKAPVITANYWWNTATPTTPSTEARYATVKPLDDGRIRVIELGHFGCPGCLETLPKMEKLRKTAPQNVEAWYVTFGEGTWGATPCASPEMAQHLKHYYVERKGYGLPIALFAGERHELPDGGSTQDDSPTFSAFSVVGYPWIVVTDGKGIVRHVSLGFSEMLVTNAVKYLTAEAVRAGSAPAAAAGTVTATP
jgi:thiol-disulfide isomerase/thioredoxin